MSNGAGGDLWIAEIIKSEDQVIAIFFVINGGGHVVGVAFTLDEARELIKKRIAAGTPDSVMEIDLELNLDPIHVENRFSIAVKHASTIAAKKEFLVIDRDEKFAHESHLYVDEAHKELIRRRKGPAPW